MKRIKYYGTGLLVFAAFVIGYHFYAANQAEEQIIALIEEYTAEKENSPFSFRHSSIEITPFTGMIMISDLTVIMDSHIERAKRFTVDLNYLDILKFYLGGTEYALKHLNTAEVLLLEPAYINRSNLRQIASDSLHVYFEGQVFDGIRAAVTDTVFGERQTIRAKGKGLRLQFPKTPIAGLKVNEFSYSGSIAAGKKYFWREGRHEVAMDSLAWKPLEAFQKKYGFFIKGFGYAPDAIPFRSAQYRSSPAPQSHSDGRMMMQVESNLESELALVSVDGYVDPQRPLGASRLESASVSISDFSNSFSRVLENMEQLLSISLPRDRNGTIIIAVEGTLSEPVIAR